VSWDDCKKFLAALNGRPGRGDVFGKGVRFRLPREDEWEFACRGEKGNEKAFFWGNELNGTEANCKGEFPYGTDKKGPYLGRPCPVDDTGGGKYEIHPWGLMHMHGNMCEWCEDKYGQGDFRVVRGGAWYLRAADCRAAVRGFNAPNLASFNIGFRVAASDR